MPPRGSRIRVGVGEGQRVYQGASRLNLDAKGRLAVPARYRDALDIASAGRLTVTRHPHGCLLIFPRSTWEQHRERIATWPMSARAWQRIFLGNATDVDIDGAGRILIGSELRDAAKLQKDVMLLGMGSHFELWDAASLADDETRAIEAGLPDVLADFSF